MNRLIAQTITVGYSDSEDRLWLRLGGKGHAILLWLTRRMLAQLIPMVWDKLAKTCLSSPGMGSMGAWQSVLLEREIALENMPPLDASFAKKTSPLQMSHPPSNEGLISEISLRFGERGATWIFRAAKTETQLAGDRMNTHRVLQLLWQQQNLACWNIAPPWSVQSCIA